MIRVDLPVRANRHELDLTVQHGSVSVEIIIHGPQAGLEVVMDGIPNRLDVDPSIAYLPSNDMVLDAKKVLLRASKLVGTDGMTMTIGSVIGKAVLDAFTSVSAGSVLDCNSPDAHANMSAFLEQNGFELAEDEVDLVLTLYAACVDALVLSQSDVDTFIQKYSSVSAEMSLVQAKAATAGRKSVSADAVSILSSQAHAVKDMTADLDDGARMELSSASPGTFILRYRLLSEVEEMDGTEQTLESLGSNTLFDLNYVRID